MDLKSWKGLNVKQIFNFINSPCVHGFPDTIGRWSNTTTPTDLSSTYEERGSFYIVLLIEEWDGEAGL